MESPNKGHFGTYKLKWLSRLSSFKRFQSHYIDRGDKIWGFSFDHYREIFNTVSLSRRVLSERFHCNKINNNSNNNIIIIKNSNNNNLQY